MHVHHPLLQPLGWHWKLYCRTKIGTVRLYDSPNGGLHSWLVRRHCLWTSTTAMFWGHGAGIPQRLVSDTVLLVARLKMKLLR